MRGCRAACGIAPCRSDPPAQMSASHPESADQGRSSGAKTAQPAPGRYGPGPTLPQKPDEQGTVRSSLPAGDPGRLRHGNNRRAVPVLRPDRIFQESELHGLLPFSAPATAPTASLQSSRHYQDAGSRRGFCCNFSGHLRPCGGPRQQGGPCWPGLPSAPCGQQRVLRRLHALESPALPLAAVQECASGTGCR